MALLEAQWQTTVLDLARVLGWRTAHFRPARTGDGSWRTAVAGDGVGFPDLVLVRDRVVVAELKSARGRTTEEQRAWLLAFEAAGVEAHVWRPDDFDDVRAVLTRRRTGDGL